LRQLRDVTWFLAIAAFIAPLIVASLQTASLAYFQVIPWAKYLTSTLHYWAGDATGIAMLAPFLLIALRKLPWIWESAENEAPAREPKMLPARREIPVFLVEGFGLLIVLVRGIIWTIPISCFYPRFGLLYGMVLNGRQGRFCLSTLLWHFWYVPPSVNLT
jgi:MASE1